MTRDEHNRNESKVTREELMRLAKINGITLNHLTKTSAVIEIAFRLGRMQENKACIAEMNGAVTLEQAVERINERRKHL